MTTRTNTPSWAARYIGLGGGIALEWYDWAVYGLMAAFIAPHFFPSSDPVISILSAFAVFALSFVVRPISSAIFGPIIDRIGHKGFLVFSITAMAVASLAMGLMPDYKAIGPAAGILVLVARLIQGISTGIEQPTANAATFELGNGRRKGFFFVVVTGSFNLGGSLIASAVALLTALIIGNQGMADWGWRVPFIIGGVGGFVVLFLRRSLPQTGAIAVVDQSGIHRSTRAVWADIWRNRLGVFAIIFTVAGSMLGYYVWITGIPGLAISSFKESATSVLAMSTILNAMMVVFGPVTGLLADRFGSPRVFLILRILLVPVYALVVIYTQPGLWLLGLVMLGGGILVSMNQVFFQYIMVTLVPPGVRATGVGIGYGIAVSVFGGTAPYLFVDASANKMLWLFAVYGAVVAALSALVYVWARSRGFAYDHAADTRTAAVIRGTKVPDGAPVWKAAPPASGASVNSERD